jgi:hypothetical protein
LSASSSCVLLSLPKRFIILPHFYKFIRPDVVYCERYLFWCHEGTPKTGPGKSGNFWLMRVPRKRVQAKVGISGMELCQLPLFCDFHCHDFRFKSSSFIDVDCSRTTGSLSHDRHQQKRLPRMCTFQPAIVALIKFPKHSLSI